MAQDELDFESGVWDFAGRDSEEGGTLHLGHCQGHSKNGEANVQEEPCPLFVRIHVNLLSGSGSMKFMLTCLFREISF
jgi:hypothetical protein